MKKKTVALLLALVMVFGAAIGGTFAYLTAKTDAVKNTFTVGNINIDLYEHDADGEKAMERNDYVMVPDTKLDKDPTVEVLKNSEACWLFVKVEKSSNLDSFISYTIADGWTALPGVDGVYYRSVDADTAAAGETYSVLANDKVTVKASVDKAMMDALTENTYPTLTFTACAVQSAGLTTAADAYAQAPADFKA